MFNKLILVLVLSLGSLFRLFSQEIKIQSVVLEKERTVTVSLPANFDSSKAYPTIYVLDGDRIGPVVSGINDYLVTCERTMPAIVIAIHQDTLRWKDCGYKFKTSELTTEGEAFHSFLKSDLVPYIDSRYKTTNYRVLVGHSFTATYLYLTWLKGEIPFNSYIALSPFLSLDLQMKVTDKFKNDKNTPDFFTVTGSNDLSVHKLGIRNLRKQLAKEKLADKIHFQDLEGKSHLTLVPVGIEEGLSDVFQDYQVLSNNYLFSKKIPIIDKSTLESYYQNRHKKYGVSLEMREEDLEFASFTLSHHRLWNQLKELSEWTIKSFPDYYSGYYGMGAYFEKQKDYKQALEYFQAGYDKLGADVLNKEDFHKDIDRVKAKVPK